MHQSSFDKAIDCLTELGSDRLVEAIASGGKTFDEVRQKMFDLKAKREELQEEPEAVEASGSSPSIQKSRMIIDARCRR